MRTVSRIEIRRCSAVSRREITGLYAITPDTGDTASLVAMTRNALAGGTRLVQYRSKTMNEELRREQARALAHLCRQFEVPLLINDHIDLALEVGADGVHLGREDAPISQARLKLGHEKIIGISCYNELGSAIEAECSGADYVAFGAFFTSVTKLDTVPASVDLLQQGNLEIRIPIVAIGGINSDNALELISAGADAVAVSNALFGARDIRSEADKFSGLFKRQPFHPSLSRISQ
ncbi:thiamine phosphate synthase [Nitrosospira multiformis]|uniref:Thiamine-phosphate synthase n=1 Tax=Nitrosospira multiformis TaxID=1231 RepID=A0A1I7HR31_9PROT|nr:thiamine phosphate synthase [Nitrosospira multiformis]SFU63198.1 thiamine-phosphate diphosphorylase [Nitrosospira multiformis]